MLSLPRGQRCFIEEGTFELHCEGSLGRGRKGIYRGEPSWARPGAGGFIEKGEPPSGSIFHGLTNSQSLLDIQETKLCGKELWSVRLVKQCHPLVEPCLTLLSPRSPEFWMSVTSQQHGPENRDQREAVLEGQALPLQSRGLKAEASGSFWKEKCSRAQDSLNGITGPWNGSSDSVHRATDL